MGIFLLISLAASVQLSFSPLDVEVKGNGYPFLKGGVLTFDVGRPSIPGYIVHLTTEDDESITVTYKHPIVLGEYDVPPLQSPAILSQREIIPVEPDGAVYTSNKEYPGKGFKILKKEYIAGKRVESILIHPLQYKSVERLLILYRDVEIEGKVSILHVISPSRAHPKSGEPGYDYLIITNGYLVPYFESLAEWKTKKGVRARIVTTDEIYSSCEGRDCQEKIREFIESQHRDSGVVWVLLGGDTDIVPSRTAFAFECGAGFADDEDSIQCDLYYSDLDGSWDSDGDDIFGEVEDSVDMIPDVFVGRAPVNSVPEVQNFVGKVLTYEKSPPTDYLTDALFFAMVLWGEPGDEYYTDGGVHKDMIDNLFMPSRFDITKLYERDGNGSATGVISAINEGKHIMNHDGHGWINVIGMDPRYIFNWDMDGLTNGDKLGILFSIGCWTAALDYDCIGEHFVNALDGGGVAYIGNSRYGWGSPGNPGYGYSDIFDNKFFEALFVDSLVNIGTALASSKAYYTPLAGYGNVYRWCEYQLNLLGDPEMPVWTDTPMEVAVAFPDSIPLGEFQLYINVLSADGSPVEGAMVTFSGADYERDITNPSGEVVLSLSTQSPGWAYITTTGMNLLPHEDSVLIYEDGAHLSLYSHYTDGELNPGDTANLFCIVKNYGGTASDLREVELTTDDTLTSVIDGTDTIPQIPPSGTDTLGFGIVISENAANGHIIRFSLVAPPKAGLLPSCIGEFAEMVKTPILTLTDVHKDGPVTPGDSGVVFLTLENAGYGMAGDVTIGVSSVDDLLQFIQSGAHIDSITPGSSVTVSFEFAVTFDCPTPHLAPCVLDFGPVDTFFVAIGCPGISDDFEGDNTWYSSGNWHIDEDRSHSPSRSFYCGDSLIREYGVNVCDSLVSPLFCIDENSTLSFWHWFNMAGLEDLDPGCDGLYIGVIDSSEFHLLDFIGSGGALDSMYNSCPFWHRSTYDLSFIPAGRVVKILFKFISNNSRCGEGWYIDDVSVQPTYLAVEEEEPEFVLFQNFPNPFNTKTVIGYRLSVFGERSPATLSIYDVSGREVRVFEHLACETSPIIWDGRDDKGKLVPGGVYFYRLEAERSNITKKLIILR